MDAEVCGGVEQEYGKVLFQSILEKYFKKEIFCTKHEFCSEYKISELLVSEFASRVLSN